MDTLRHFFSGPAKNNQLVCLSAADLKEFLSPEACFEALLQAYRKLAEDRDSEPKTLGFHSGEGTFHIKAGLYPGTRHIFAAKINANFPGNPGRGLPTVQGLVALIDAGNGRPLAVMDSGELTAIRTAAAAALAASFGARKDSRVVSFIGCGFQAGYVGQALNRIFRFERLYAVDLDAARGRDFANRYDAIPCRDIEKAVSESDIIVTCTSSKEPVLKSGMVRPGAFIAAIGADNPDKQELETGLFKNAVVIVDDREKCALDGEVSRALREGVIAPSEIRGDLAELASGRKRARTSQREIVIFDSVGTGLQDVAAAAAAYAAAGKTF